MSPLRDQGQHPAGRDPSTAQYADLETGSVAQVQVLPVGPVGTLVALVGRQKSKKVLGMPPR